MNKKTIAIMLSALTALSSVPAVSAADNDKVEIAFKVGDSVLRINGQETEVETPYIAGDGVTLVPLRVITEAFGTQVDWEGETKTITLTYPDVNIILQIGNPTATVNDHKETLPEAPALSENGVTMVPLRFISETFGATVGYEDATQAILVTKEKVASEKTVTGITELSRTGDSYYRWSIDTPVQMKMTDRSLDGLSTTFAADDGSELTINIYNHTDDNYVEFDEEFAKMKESFSGYTLTEAEKLTDDAGNKYMHLQAKDKEKIIDFYEYYGANKTTYDVIGSIKSSDDNSAKDVILAASESFKIGDITKDTYDLSTVSAGMRTIKDDKYKFSFIVPADYIQVSIDTENEFRFNSSDKDSNAYVAFEVFSKTADVTAKSLADSDHDQKVKVFNSDYADISAVTSNDGVYRYTYEISGSSKDDCYMTDTFFEKGDYVYNMAVRVDSADDLQLSERIFSSLQTEEIDSSVVGKLLRNDPDSEVMSSRTVGDWTFELPASWQSTARLLMGSGDSAAFTDTETGSLIHVIITKNDEYTKGNISKISNDYASHIKKTITNELTLGDMKIDTINSGRYAHFNYSYKNDDGRLNHYNTWMRPEQGEMLVVTLMERDVFYHKKGNDALSHMIETMKKK